MYKNPYFGINYTYNYRYLLKNAIKIIAAAITEAMRSKIISPDLSLISKALMKDAINIAQINPNNIPATTSPKKCMPK